jgi:hypothetical protein
MSTPAAAFGATGASALAIDIFPMVLPVIGNFQDYQQ